jgi:hypothetical protein
MPKDLREAIDAVARHALAALTDHPGPARAVVCGGGRVCLVAVWSVGPMPTGSTPLSDPTPSARRTGCRADILAALTTAGVPLTRRQLVRVLRQRRTPHGSGTVAKALAELTRSGRLHNPKDKIGYRLTGMPPAPPPHTPDLFD